MSKEAMKLAQDWYDSGNENPDDFADMIKTVIALAQQPAQQEPCDMGNLCIGCSPRNADGSCPGEKPNGACDCYNTGFNDGMRELELPPQRKPLTDEQAKQASEAIEQIMEHAQVFASAWSLVGGRFDLGNAMEDAEQAKIELRTMVASLAREAAHGIKEQP